MVAIYTKKIIFCVICATLMYIKGRLLTWFWSVKCLGLSKTLALGFSQKTNDCQILHIGTTHEALPVLSTFSGVDHMLRSRQWRTLLIEKCMFLSD